MPVRHPHIYFGRVPKHPSKCWDFHAKCQWLNVSLFPNACKNEVKQAFKVLLTLPCCRVMSMKSVEASLSITSTDSESELPRSYINFSMTLMRVALGAAPTIWSILFPSLKTRTCRATEVQQMWQAIRLLPSHVSYSKSPLLDGMPNLVRQLGSASACFPLSPTAMLYSPFSLP